MPSYLIWFYGIFFVIMGARLMVKCRELADSGRFFECDAYDQALAKRVRGVLDARFAVEGSPASPWFMAGAFTVLLGGATLIRLLAPDVSYALMCLVLATALAGTYLRMRNTGPKRFAALNPRTLASALPTYWYIVGGIVALTPLAHLSLPELRISAWLVALAALIMLGTAAAVAGMRAILTGDDPHIEGYIDDRLRKIRTGQMMILLFCSVAVEGFCVPMTWVWASWYHAVIALVPMCALIAFVVWFFRRKRPLQVESVA